MTAWPGNKARGRTTPTLGTNGRWVEGSIIPRPTTFSVARRKVTGPGNLSHVINLRHNPLRKTAAFLYILPEIFFQR